LSPNWLAEWDCSLDDFRAVVEQTTDPAAYPFADSVEENVPVYGDRVRGHLADAPGRRQVMDEWVHALAYGPGVVVFRRAFPDDSVVDRATEIFRGLIADQHAAGTAGGDHFAKPGTNDRVWGALDKFALRDPELFGEYYANDMLALVSAAWLGPGYQVTSQINVVNPGGTSQVAHRDYHLGFMSKEQAASYPTHVHRLSQALTLQGAVAHSDMPVDTGPTMYLPYSQQYVPGYLATHLPEFSEYFEQHYVQLPLEKGDAAFFNPALFHGAGTNRSTDVRRMANLLQVSSGFGRAMEYVDRTAICEAVYPVLLERHAAGVPEQELRNIVAACAEGYPFPTNLDRDQPVAGLAPSSQAELVWNAVAEQWDPDRLGKALARHQGRRTGRSG
jgi:ectoine hydroxylase-related dioxygenase (phytanoyl-CoA dioxygenase family)